LSYLKLSQHQLRVFVSWLGKNDLQNHASLFCFLAREKTIYKIMPRFLISWLGKK